MPNEGPKSAWEVLRIFRKLGLTCFGGPVAHIGYFREEFVARRKWIDEQAYADLVGLCQFLPGPASSQAGFSIGLTRAGYLGALAAWTGFTLPSAAILVLFAYGAGALSEPIGAGLLRGLKLTAVAIVAQAVWGMARNLCPDRERASIAVMAALIILFSTASIAQIGAIVLGGAAGLWLCRSEAPASPAHIALPVSRSAGAIALAVFFVLLGGAACDGEPHRIDGRGPVRRLLSFRRARIRWWPCRPPAPPRGLRRARLDK
jgi:chromate transporter